MSIHDIEGRGKNADKIGRELFFFLMFISSKRKKMRLGVVVHACNPSIWEEHHEFKANQDYIVTSSQFVLQSKTPSQKTNEVL